MSLLFSEQCDKCGKRYENWSYTYIKWCESCQINYLKNNFINWTSENEKIDDFIQKKQLKINHSWNSVFEWIPYDQFNEIKEIVKNDFVEVHTAIWKDGPLHFSNKWIRKSNGKVVLKCIYNSQNITDEFFNEACNFFISL